MNILIAGDFYVSDLFNNSKLLSNSLLKVFNNSDLNILNLESPLIENIKTEKINKIGPHLQSKPETTIPYLKELNIDLVTLANNHIMDYGERGVKSTLDSLKENKIEYVGCGLRISDASKYFIVEKNDLKIAILNFAENEWSIATEKNAGANPLDIIGNCRQIREANLENDKVICIIHGGHENYNYPSPNMVKLYKYYVECGADAIIAHHTHCISGFETYKGAPIVYGLGNFIFTIDHPNKEFNKGLIAKLKVTKGENICLSLIPITQEKSTFKLNLSLDNEKEKILNEVQGYSKIISDVNLLNSEWIKFIRLKKNEYLFLINPVQILNNKYLLSALRKIRVDKYLLNKKLKAKFLHLIRCEAHQDIILSVLDDE